MRVRADVVAVPTAPGRHRRLGRRAGSGGPGVGVHRADVVAVHARRSHRPWHARPHEAPTRGVGPGTLATVVGLALVAGVGTGAAADRYGVTPASVVGSLGGLPGGASAAGAPTGGGGAAQPDRGGPAAPDVVTPSTAPDPSARLPVAPPEPTLPAGVTAADAAAGIRAADVPAAGSGELVVVPGEEAAPASGAPVTHVRVEVEQDLAVDGEAFAAFVMATLNDPRGWGADGSVTFARTAGDADVRVVLATPATVDALCAPLTTRSLYSCGRDGHAVLNAERWWHATEEYVGLVGEDVTGYRQYLVNHEVGHLLGRQHASCPAAGQPAPVMQQQTVRIAPCEPNAWPFPG